MTKGTADFSNNSEDDYNLYVELMENDEYKARLYYDSTGDLCLRFYGSEGVVMPFDWLLAIIHELKKVPPPSK